MPLLRMIAIFLPQALVLLIVGGYFDLLGGWNQSDSALGTLIALFLLAPLSVLVLLVAEVTHFIRASARGQAGSAWWILLAVVLVLEAFAIDLLILSQARM
ncbi:MAG: hypothetical protein P8Y91_00670 [Desulfuromonadales bacterium]|jgi:hypothetical protein